MVCRLQHPHAQNQVGEFSEEVALQISLRGAGVIIGVSIDVGPNGEIVAEVAQCEWLVGSLPRHPAIRSLSPS